MGNPSLLLTCISKCILLSVFYIMGLLISFGSSHLSVGQQPHNNRSIETQLMTRFLRDHNHSSFADIEDFQDEFSPLFHNRRRVVGTLSGTDAFIHLPLPLNGSINSEKLHFSLPSHSSRDVLTEDEQEQLKNLYSQLYNLPVSEILVNRAFMQYKEISLKHTVSIGQNNAPHDHLLFKALWFKTHPECNFYGKPLTIWEHELFDASLINPQRACAEGYSSQLNLCVCVCLSDASNAR